MENDSFPLVMRLNSSLAYLHSRSANLHVCTSQDLRFSERGQKEAKAMDSSAKVGTRRLDYP